MTLFSRILTCLAALSMLTASSQSTTLDTLVDNYARKTKFSGTVLVADKGKIIYQHFFGLTDRANATPVNVETNFKIASITKTFTATIIMQLYEQGKIDLDKPISFYLEDYSGELKDSATIHHLLTYSSGMENLDQSSEAMYAMKLSTDSIVRLYCSGRKVFSPGTRMDYKNAEYILLGKIIEKITGKSYEKILDENIIKPLHLQHTGYLHNGDIVKNLANTYLLDSAGKFQNDDPYWIENFYSSGAMYSSAADLLKFDQALFTNKLLKESTVKLMTTSYPQLWGVAYSFWVTDQQFAGKTFRVMDRRGSISGANAAWYHFMDSNKTIIVLSNSNAGDVVALREEIAEGWFR